MLMVKQATGAGHILRNVVFEVSSLKISHDPFPMIIGIQRN